MDLQLTKKVAIITGGTSGIGLAIAKSLYAEGAKVIITGRNHEKLIQAKAKITNNTTTTNVDIVNVDLGTKTGCQALIDKVSTADILINNLGPYYESDFLDSEIDDKLLTLFETNVMSATRLSQHYIRNMLTQNSGRIIFIGSDASIKVPANMIEHGIVKAGLLALKNGLAELTKHTNVTVNAVLPGPTMTEGVEEYFKG